MATSVAVGAAAPALPVLCGHEGCRRIAGHDEPHSRFPLEAWDFLEDKDRDKISKAGYATPRGGQKGAYQNHVYRNNRVIIPFERFPNVNLGSFRDGFVVRLLPEQCFAEPGRLKDEFTGEGAAVKIGENAFVLYRSHDAFESFPPLQDWSVRTLFDEAGRPLARRRKDCIDRGHYVLRLPTANGKAARNEGAPQGIFAPEYADEETNYLCQALLAWLTIHTTGSPHTEAVAQHLKAVLVNAGLSDANELGRRGVMRNGLAVCPLCTRAIGYKELHQTISFEDVPGLENAAIQIDGATRSTVINLFHIEPLLYSRLSHLPMNIAWGHATCNTKLGQRHCYSLTELVEQDLKVAVLRETGPESFGWISGDFEMIRSDNGAVWVRLVSDAPAEQLQEELAEVIQPAAN